MRTLTIRIYPFRDVHTEEGDGARLSESRLSLIRDELPELFRVGFEGTVESFRAVVDLRPDQLEDTSVGLEKADVQRHLDRLVRREQQAGETEGSWIARVLLSKQLGEQLSTYGALFDLGDGDRPARRGCAVFLNAIDLALPGLADLDQMGLAGAPISSLEDYRDRFFLRILGHEVGHVLNLCHQAEVSATMMSEGKPDIGDLTNMVLTDLERKHLTSHAEENVRPGSTVVYGGCSVTEEHLNCKADASAKASAIDLRAINFQLVVHPGTIYSGTVVPTLVIGEPLCISVLLENRSDEAIFVDGPADGAHRGLLVVAQGFGDSEDLVSPVLACADRETARLRVDALSTFETHETLIHRRGRLVFPEPGMYRVFAVLRLVGGQVASQEVTVHVAPPLKPRHERYCRLAGLHSSCLDLELGGSQLLSEPDHAARELLRDAPDFPLCDHIRLAAGRWAHRAGTAPYPSWRASLERVERNAKLPIFLREEARRLNRPLMS